MLMEVVMSATLSVSGHAKLGVEVDGLYSVRMQLRHRSSARRRGRPPLGEGARRRRAPLNPVEYLWSHWKQHELPNFSPSTFGQLSHHARQALRRMRRRPTLVAAFWQQADLFPL